jgi:transposase
LSKTVLTCRRTSTVRVTTAFNRLLDLPGVSVTDVSFGEDRVIVDVALTRQRLACPEAGCGFTTRARYDTRPVSSCWRHLDLGRWGLVVRADLRRLVCPSHGVKIEAVPFARHRSGFTRDFEDVIAYLATRTDKTSITRLQRIDWDTVGRICARTVADGLDTDRLDGLVAIGVDEVSWKKHHNYLTLVADHTGRKIVWGAEGKDSETLDAFFADLGPERAAELAAVSMDMGPAFAKSVRKQDHAPQAVICIDPFHAVKLVGEALDTVRREAWNQMRELGDPAAAKKFKGARWSLLKNPENLTDEQASTLRRLRRKGGGIWRAYRLKESFRAIFAGDLDADDAAELIDRWTSQAQRSQLPAFVKVAKTIRKFRDGILASIHLKINNGRAEGLNNHVRLLIRRAYGFHTATAALALVMLTCGPITLVLPWEKPPTRTR